MAKILRQFLIYLGLVVVTNISASEGVLRIPLHAAKISLDPSGIQDLSSLFVSRQVNCQLVRSYGSIMSLEAAESIHWVNPTKISIKIKNDITFHDGTSVTAEDVATSFYHLKHSRHTLRNMFNWVKDIDVINSKELIINLKVPVPQFLNILSSPNYAIFKKEFLDKASKNSSLWAYPLGCGKYRVIESNYSSINLVPIRKGYPIRFILNQDDELNANDIKNYDIIDLHLVNNYKIYNGYRSVEIFDPTQIYIGLNTKNNHWKDKNSRCALFAKLNTSELLKKYGDQGKFATDLLPKGVLGYKPSLDYLNKLAYEYKENDTPKIDKFCLSYLTVSVPKQYRNEYKKMIQSIYPNIITNDITDNRKFGIDFVKSKCDALVVGIKSNTLDGYDLLALFSMPYPNFTGYLDPKISKEIEDSQNEPDPAHRYNIYRNIVDKVEANCLAYPVLTIPMKLVYVSNNFVTPDIGKGPLNEYDLSIVQ